MTIPDPGGTFTTGPATTPILNEPVAQVAMSEPTGPAPGTGPLSSYVDARPVNDAQKAALLSSIAQLGSAGKQAWVQQQQQTNNTRAAAIQSMSAAGGMGATPDGVMPAIQGAFAGQQQAAVNQQGNLDRYEGNLSGAAGDWYNRTGAAIPIMEERTKQQVNSYYAAQRLQAQKDAAQLAASLADKAASLQIAQANAQAANSRATGAASSAQAAASRAEGAAAKYGSGAAQVNSANKAIGTAVASTPGFEDGTPGSEALWGALGATDPQTGKPLNYAQIRTLIDNAYKAGAPTVKGVDRTTLEAFVDSYFKGNPLPKPQNAPTPAGNAIMDRIGSVFSGGPPVVPAAPTFQPSPALLAQAQAALDNSRLKR